MVIRSAQAPRIHAAAMASFGGAYRDRKRTTINKKSGRAANSSRRGAAAACNVSAMTARTANVSQRIVDPLS